jgi:hypothetical protein
MSTAQVDIVVEPSLKSQHHHFPDDQVERPTSKMHSNFVFSIFLVLKMQYIC